MSTEAEPLYALTIHRPWTDAIVSMPGRHAKRVENRTWYRKSLVGQRFAIHAGQRYCRSGAAFVSELAIAAGDCCGGWLPPVATESPMGIVGVARLRGVVDAGPTPKARLVDGEWPDAFVWNEWWMGGIGWLLDDVRPIEPLACKGAQGLWRVPAEHAAEVRTRAGLAPEADR